MYWKKPAFTNLRNRVKTGVHLPNSSGSSRLSTVSPLARSCLHDPPNRSRDQAQVKPCPAGLLCLQH